MNNLNIALTLFLTLHTKPQVKTRGSKKHERSRFRDLSTNNNKLKNLTLPVSSGRTNP